MDNTGDAKELEITAGETPGSGGTPETIFGPADVALGEVFDFAIPTTGPPNLSFYVDGDSIAVDHADDNYDDLLHVSCSQSIDLGEPIHRTEGEPGNDLTLDRPFRSGSERVVSRRPTDPTDHRRGAREL